MDELTREQVLKEAARIESNGCNYDFVAINSMYFLYENKVNKCSSPLFMLKEKTKQYLKDNGFAHLSFEKQW